MTARLGHTQGSKLSNPAMIPQMTMVAGLTRSQDWQRQSCPMIPQMTVVGAVGREGGKEGEIY